MPKLKPGTLVPNHEENTAITSAALSDPDAVPMTDEEWSARSSTRRLGRPVADVTKERITIRLSADVLQRFRSGGPGWQTRIDAALKDWLARH